MIDSPEFDVTIPLVRRREDGTIDATKDTHDITVRIPAVDEETARELGHEIAFVITHALPSVGANNRFGWKLANYGVAVEQAPTGPGRATTVHNVTGLQLGDGNTQVNSF